MVNAVREREVWRQYSDPKYPFIEVSNLGRVRTKDRYVPNGGGKRLVKGQILKQYPNKDGYMIVTFSVNGKSVSLRISRMVAITFIPNPNDYQEVNHKDCNRKNNAVSNLEWCSHQENIAYRDKLGHHVNNNPGHPVIAISLDTFDVLWFESQMEAERQLGVDHSHINSVVKGKQNTTGGFWFCDADGNSVEKVRAKFGDKMAKKVEELMSNES